MPPAPRLVRARSARAQVGAAAAIIGAVLLSGCSAAGAITADPHVRETAQPAPRLSPSAAPAPIAPTTAPASGHEQLQSIASALELIDESAAIPPYRRADFGDGWVDVDRNGCSTRQDILQRDLEGETVADDGCTVLTGTLAIDPYTGQRIDFAHDRVGGDSQAVQIDHIISLSSAHRGGAWAWSFDERVAFANDPATLLAVDGPTNSAKSDRGPGDWMPEDPGYWCEYAARYARIAHGYGLAVSSEDKRMLVDVLEACG
ncbi:HNH endonuclease family protein [Agrococcus sp. Marseille-Q4369]|uniref:HNH endonuclease family protein n=1 Tax=Agrococcus sp. Marseille-Q4369 TaxID=2810513 RepID=UPI001B8AE2CA|nr:HNH endonuclease family protein [Agrococcus sp. Marseille-Q4369]QUW17878.1 HNH endonuclease [Agrococcus sp. Marseille-Q4369]